MDQVCLVATCERVELYAYDPGGPDPEAMITTPLAREGAVLTAVRATSRWA